MLVKNASHPAGLSIELVEMPPLDEVERHWRDLQERSDISFFTSWTWIGAWLRNLPPEVQPRLLLARLNGRWMGAGILVLSTVIKARCVPMRVWHLHETGRPDLDKITIEYNGLVIDDTVKHFLEPMMIRHLIDQGGGWDEIQFNALRRPVLPPRRRRHCQAKIKRVRQPAYQISLVDVRQAGQHTALLKQKPRYHIKRSLQSYQKEWGAVTIEAAQSLSEALTWMEALKKLHSACWSGRRVEGAFNTPFFNQFHDDVIREGFERGEVQILAIKAGQQDIAYLYNFVWKGHVYNYQSGVNYDAAGGKNSPGLVSHTLAIDLNTALGHHTYDLMAGDHHYKRALSLQTIQLDWFSLRSPTLCTKAEDGVRLAAHIGWRLSAQTHRLPEWLAASAPLILPL